MSARCKHLSLLVPYSSMNPILVPYLATFCSRWLGDITRLLSYNITVWRDWRDVQHFFESCLHENCTKSNARVFFSSHRPSVSFMLHMMFVMTSVQLTTRFHLNHKETYSPCEWTPGVCSIWQTCKSASNWQEHWVALGAKNLSLHLCWLRPSQMSTDHECKSATASQYGTCL